MSGLSLLFVALLLPSVPEKVHVIADLPYSDGGGYKQQLDLFLPATRGFPTIVFVHGGSLVSGDRKGFLDYEPYADIAQQFANLGIGCAVISYRLGPENKWPTMAYDVAAAFSWVSKNIASYGGNKGKVFLVGHSSGAHLAAVVASDEKYLAKYGSSLLDVAGCVPISTSLHPSFEIDDMTQSEAEQMWESYRKGTKYESIFPTPADYRDADPLHHVSSLTPRFMILVADDEVNRTPAVEHADLFIGEMQRHGRRARLEIMENRKHMTTIQKMAKEGDPILLMIADFVKRR